MKTKRHSQKDTPEQDSPTTECQQRHRQHDQRYIIKLVEPAIESLVHQVGCITLQLGLVLELRCAGQDPTNVGPPASVARRVRIALFIGMRMMNAMRRGPLYRSTFEREGATEDQKVLDNFRYFIAAMRHQAMIAHADAETAADP